MIFENSKSILINICERYTNIYVYDLEICSQNLCISILLTCKKLYEEHALNDGSLHKINDLHRRGITIYPYFTHIPVHVYRKVADIRRTLVGNKIVDHSDVVGASPVGAAPTSSSLST